MIFETWEITDDVSRRVGRCQTENDVREEYHDMGVFEQRQSEVNSSFFVVRIW